MYETLRDYLKDSELRIADKNLHIRMSPELANKLGLNAEKLLYTTDYQKEVLQKMSNLVKMNQNIIKPMDDVKR